MYFKILLFDVRKRRRSLKRSSSEGEESSSECDQPVSLARLEDVSVLPTGLFMMETSGRAKLTARQACAVESAAYRSGLAVYVVMFSDNLQLKDNTTCQLYRSVTHI